MAGFTNESAFGARDADANLHPDDDAKLQHGFDTGTGETDTRRSSLISTIQGEIIPRLMLAYQTSPRQTTLPERVEDGWPGTQDIETLTRYVVLNELDTARRHIESLVDEGIALETIYLKLLAPVAARLGHLWEEDRLDFTQVTIGLWGLQSLLRDFGLRFLNDCHTNLKAHTILLAPVPGEQHSFGLSILADFFLRDGWMVRYEPSIEKNELVNLVSSEYFDIVGLSSSCGTLVESLPLIIRSVREASLNKTVRVLVGGQLFNDTPDLVQHVGADAMAKDCLEALQRAEDLIGAGHECQNKQAFL